MNSIKLHGNFEKINNGFINESFEALGLLETIQNKYKKTDNDTIINEARDSKVAQVLGYGYINVDKHGWDAKKDTDEFLEVKQASAAAGNIGATFNDTSLEKALELSNVTIGLAVWSSLKKLLFVVYGMNPAIGPDIKQKILIAMEKGHIRPGTQSISMKDLIFKYGFKIKPVEMSKKDIYNFLREKNGFKTYLKKQHRELPFDNEA